MKQPIPQDSWPESWKSSFPYDLQEVFGQYAHRGYAYAYQNRRDHALALVRAAAAPPASILDVAAAQGNFSLALAEMGYHVTWNDLRGDLAEYVKLKYEKGVLNFAPGNVFDLCFEAEFDIVLITEIIEHVAHPDDFLRKIGRLVKPGGHVVMTTPNGGYFLNRLPKFSECTDPAQFEAMQFKPNSDGHIFLLHESELEALAVSAGLVVKQTAAYTNPLTNGHLKMEAALRRMKKKRVNQIEALTESLPGFLRRRIHTSLAVLMQRPS